MKRSNRRTFLAALAAFALVAAACGGGGGGDGGGGGQAAECSWTIGTVGALSGDFASIGLPIQQGIEFAVNDINEQGDLACELELQSEDSQGDPEQAAPLAQKLVQNPDLVAIVGPYFSGETLATGQIFNDAGIAFICPSCTDQTIDDQGWDTFFRAVADDAVQGAQAANYIENGLNADTTAVVHDNQQYSKGLADTVKQELGSAAKGPFIINPEETDYSAVVSQVKNVQPDVVFYGGYVPQGGPLAQQLAEAGVNAQFLSDDGTKDNSFGELAGSAATGAQVTCPCADPAEFPEGKAFIQGMRQEFGEPPGTFAAEAWDATHLVAEALKDFDAESDIEGEIRQGVIDYLDNVQGYQGIVKPYTFLESGNVDVGPEGIFIWEWNDKVGDFTILGAVDDLVKQ